MYDRYFLLFYFVGFGFVIVVDALPDVSGDCACVFVAFVVWAIGWVACDGFVLLVCLLLLLLTKHFRLFV